jgi:tetratricopeptide (TPR) repeat protein/predicted Ser/Thr protein kinase
LIGEQLGAYAIESELGSGGMGTVYRATGPEGVVALKVVHPHLLDSPEALRRFEREAGIGQRIRQKNLVQTLDVGTVTAGETTVHYLVMEYVEGQTLKDFLQGLSRIPDHLLFLIADQVLEALVTIHTSGVIHRDLKPENVVITSDHRVLLMDFGLAHSTLPGSTLTRAGEFLGSLTYAAPEQFQDARSVTQPCDIYSLGVVLFELATGVNPFAASEPSELLRRKLAAVAPRPSEYREDIEPFWDEVITTCLQREPSARFQSALELQAVLSQGERSEWWSRHRAVRERAAIASAVAALQVCRVIPQVGREKELEQLAEAYQSVLNGKGHIVFLEGPHGAGKSRITCEFLEGLAGSGSPRAIAAKVSPSGRQRCGPFFELARRLLGIPMDAAQGAEAGEAIEWTTLAGLPNDANLSFTKTLLGLLTGPERDRVRDGPAVADFASLFRSVARSHPLVVILDDLHLADADTLRLLDDLSGCFVQEPILFLGTYETPSGQDAEGFESRFASLTALRRYTKITLSPLTRRESDRLLRLRVRNSGTVRALSRLLYERCEGVPGLTLDLLGHMESSELLRKTKDGWTVEGNPEQAALPESTAQLLGARLRVLEDDHRELLDAAAVLGLEFDATLLCKVLGLRRLAVLKRLAVLERKFHLVTSSGKDSFRFVRHGEHEFLYSNIPTPLRVEYHAKAADVLEQRRQGVAGQGEGDRGDRLAGEVLRHLIESGRGTEAGSVIDRGLRHFAAHYRETHVLDLLDKLSHQCVASPTAMRLEIALARWDALHTVGQRSDLLRILEEARGLAEAAGDAAKQAKVHALLGVTQFQVGNHDSASASAERALALAREAGDREWEANALHALGAIERQRGDYTRCADFWRHAVIIRQEIGDRFGEARSLAALAVVMPEVGEGALALETKQAAFAIFRELGNRLGQAAMLNNFGNTHVSEGRMAEAVECYQQSIDIARELGDLEMEGRPTCHLAKVFVSLGSEQGARDCLKRALALFREGGISNGVLDALRARAEALASFGDLDGARSALEEGRDLAESSGSKPVQCEIESRLASVLHHSGMRDEAWQAFERARALAEEVKSASQRHTVLREMGLAVLREGNSQRAARLLEQAQALAREAQDAHFILQATVDWARLPGGNAEAALATLRKYEEQLGHGRKMEHSFRLWEIAKDRSHLVEAKRLLAFAVDHAPEEYRDSMIENVPLHRDIMKAWEEHGEKG